MALVFAPAVLIAFSRSASGAVKIRWVLYALLPWLIQQGSIVLVGQLRSFKLAQFLSAISPGFLVWFFAWLIYLAYRQKFHPDAKSVEGFRPKLTLVVVLLVLGLVLARWGAWAIREKPVLLPWVLFYGFEIALLIAVVKWNRNLAFRMIAVVLVLFAADRLAWFDNALAEREFAKLCKEQAGTKIYKTVELGPEYFTAEGELVFLSANGQIDSNLFPAQFVFARVVNQRVEGSMWARATRTAYEIKEKGSGTLLAEFSFLTGERGGPPGLNPDYRPMISGDCPPKFIHSQELVRQVFTGPRRDQ